MTVAPGFEYPAPTNGGYTPPTPEQSTSIIGPRGLSDVILDLTNPNKIGISKRGDTTPPPRGNDQRRPTHRANPNDLAQLIEALASLYDDQD